METNAENRTDFRVLSFDIGIRNLGYCDMTVSRPVKTRASRSKVSPTTLPTVAETPDAADTPAVPVAPVHAVTINSWDVLTLALETENAKKISLNTIANRLFIEMEKLIRDSCGAWDAILIENQPSSLNGHMKSIQMMLYSFFQLHKHKLQPTLEVLLISANGKLQTHEEAEKTLPPCSLEKGYRLNKWKSVHITNYYVKDDNALKELVTSHRKKDDLCDAFLQAMSWYNKKNKCNIDSVKSCPMQLDA